MTACVLDSSIQHLLKNVHQCLNSGRRHHFKRQMPLFLNTLLTLETGSEHVFQLTDTKLFTVSNHIYIHINVVRHRRESEERISELFICKIKKQTCHKSENAWDFDFAHFSRSVSFILSGLLVLLCFWTPFSDFARLPVSFWKCCSVSLRSYLTPPALVCLDCSALLRRTLYL